MKEKILRILSLIFPNCKFKLGKSLTSNEPCPSPFYKIIESSELILSNSFKLHGVYESERGKMYVLKDIDDNMLDINESVFKSLFKNIPLQSNF